MKNEPNITRLDSAESPGNAADGSVAVSDLPERFQASAAVEDAIDADLVKKTKHQIRSLVAEIAELSKSEVELEDFFQGFLNRTTSALASNGGAIWLQESAEAPIELKYHVNLEQSVLAGDPQAQQTHSKLLAKLKDAGEPALIPANSGSSGDDEGGNPTDNLLIVGPLQAGGKTVGLVEIFQRPGAGPATQRGYLKFLAQMCEIANNFLTQREIRRFTEQQSLWQNIDAFVHAVHGSLDPEQTCFAIANESRRIIDCDRVSVAIIQGRRCSVKAVSGLDSIERRAQQIKLMQKLVSVTTKTGQPLWYCGEDKDLPPQIEKRLHAFIDQSHAKMLAIIPLKREPAKDSPKSSEETETIGALIVERMTDSQIDAVTQRRINAIAAHSQSAISNATTHHQIFLLPLWQAIGKATRPFTGSNFPRTLFGLSIAAAVIAFFALFPYPFALSANGHLQPIDQKEIFAQVDGILQEVYVNDGESTAIEKNQILAKMTNSELMLQIQNLEGEINQTREQIRKYQRAQFSAQEINDLEAVRLDGEFTKAEELLASKIRELALKKQQAQQLTIRSPSDGLVINWQVRRSLLRRPVNRGQNLMTVVDPSGGWQIEIDIPERRIGHLMNHLKSSTEPIEVRFTMVSRPSDEFVGQLRQIDQKLEVYSDDGNTAKAIVSFDNPQIPADLLKPGTKVTAKLFCGTRSLGFVWFHELFETVETTYKYWF